MDDFPLPGSSLHKVVCPRCKKDFDQEKRMPFQRPKGCGHTLCGVCVYYEVKREKKRACPMCTYPAILNDDNNYSLHQDMMEDMKAYEKLKLDYAMLYKSLEDAQRKNTEARHNLSKLTDTTYSGFTRPDKGSRPDQSEMNMREGRWQFVELLQAVKNLKYDCNLVSKYCQFFVLENGAMNTVSRAISREKYSDKYRPTHSIRITGIPLSCNMHKWFLQVIARMNINGCYATKMKIEKIGPTARAFKAEFATEEGKNQFLLRFDGIMARMYGTAENRPVAKDCS